jgi:UDP-glucose 4-epimerase
MAALSGNPNILVTGGAGYIATHTIVLLIEAGYDVTVVDNLVNSCCERLARVKTITGCSADRIRFHEQDLCDAVGLERIFSEQSKPFISCLHFAGLKAVGESVAFPLRYYTNNLDGTINLLTLMDKYGCHSIVFSSSATV